ncbi:ComEC/Rec2 family competence protein [Entomospira culicis]|uniref:ComEC/Rec2 family competence protein n=1 Tax=Entomospira culicis TaxID=2719989 RepID=UPI002368A163|nr:ComEC/Rec2 family competence protein [Entomospira culicis]WDI37847.1 ComEC/Rec2 family competence protein [Entomospira culicis]
MPKPIATTIKHLFVTFFARHGSFTILLLTLELLFIPILWLLHLAITAMLSIKQHRLKLFIGMITIHLLLSFHLYRYLHPTIAIPINAISQMRLTLQQDAIPNALERATVQAYSLTLGATEIQVYQRLPLRVSFRNLDKVLPRGSVLSAPIKMYQEKNGTLYISVDARQMTLERFASPLWQWREKTMQQIKHLLESRLQSSAGLYLAVTLGDRSLLSPHTARLFQATGLAHLLALSGMHATFLIATIFFLLKKFSLRQRFILLLPIVILHALLAGMLYTLLRAYIMAITLLIGRLDYRHLSVLDTLAFSSILLLLYDPQVLLSLSFHLSFVSVLGIILFYRPIFKLFKQLAKPLPKKVRNHSLTQVIFGSLAISFAVELLLNPLILFHFKEMQLFSFLSNLLFPILFLGFLLLGSLTLIAPVLLPFLTFFDTLMHHALQHLDIYRISPSWQFIAIIHLPLALSLLFWHNRRR